MACSGGFSSVHEEETNSDQDEANPGCYDHGSSNASNGSYGGGGGSGHCVVSAAVTEHHVIRHIDRNILACQICQGRYKEPKVSKTKKPGHERGPILFGQVLQ